MTTIGGGKLLIERGSIVSFAWDFEHLPLLPNTWLDGLRLRTIAFIGNRPESSDALAPPLAQLENMYCAESGLTTLHLGSVPKLTKLSCGYNQLTTLDLSLAPKLTDFVCDNGVQVLNAPEGLHIKWEYPMNEQC